VSKAANDVDSDHTQAMSNTLTLGLWLCSSQNWF